MNNTASLRTIDAYRLSKAPHWASAYRQDRTRERAGPEVARPNDAASTSGVVVPFRQRA